jgi:signal transduction histidine kinase
VPVRFDDQVLGVYEVYQDLGPIRPVRPLVWGAVSAGFIILLLALFAVVQGAARVIREQQGGTAFLANASAELTRSLDSVSTLQSLARLVVPALAEACVVDGVQADGSLGRLVMAQLGATGETELVVSGPGHPLGLCGCRRLAEALRTRRAVAYRFEPELWLSLSAGSAEACGDRSGDRWRWAMSVPLVARGQVLGAFTCLRGNGRGQFRGAVLALAEDLAGRCALALENARLYQEAQTAIRARDEFLSVAAHELKTPTTTVLGFAQLLLHRLDRGETVGSRWVRGTLGTIEHQAQRLSQLVVQLLDVSRLEAGKLVLDPRPTDLASLVEEMVSAARLRTTQHQIVLRVPGPTPALVDALRLEQVLGNLLDNAIKFSPAGGQIDVELAACGPQQVRLKVRDRGIGIPPEKRARIFDRLYQAHEGDPLTRVGGMGLGLFISRQIVELHGGQMDVESPSDGGTRLIVNLPTRIA